ncbi:DUF6954 family protein [Paenibacillus monticola]|uniref:Uncharacterized protein n=1 Tax=Paenibacillus monticola TaxID=2666075 RepID=A0A7X2H3F5_9BACL|nr:hypothetical protein [Paenibacillus monticola]MRN52859.1 hypothetical protein [Paenibacillus monticola]
MVWLINFLFVLLYGLTTLFGLGPVLFADGSNKERTVTLVVVLLIYVAITILLRIVLKRRGKH